MLFNERGVGVIQHWSSRHEAAVMTRVMLPILILIHIGFIKDQIHFGIHSFGLDLLGIDHFGFDLFPTIQFLA
jgi:hypothetical protein